jgi:hypothetical protein
MCLIVGFAIWLLLVGGAGAVDPVQEAGKLLDELPNLAEKAAQAKSARPPLSVKVAEARVKAMTERSERWQKLVKGGVISRAEADTSIMDVFVARLGLERAKLAEARTQLVMAEGAAADRVGPTASLGDATTAVSEAEAHVLAAQRELDRVRLEITRTALERFRKLYAEHLIPKAQMVRMENTVSELEKSAAASSVPTTAPAPASAFGSPPPPLPQR